MDQDPLLELDEPVLQVKPGGEVRTRLTVHNSGADVERYRLEILGDAARWAHVEPRHVTAQPGAAAPGVDVVFRPPPASRSAASARDVRFGVRALSLENRDRAGVVEGDLQISPVRDLAARIEPARAVGRWSAAYRTVLDNRGGWPLTLRLSGSDQHQALSYAVAPRELTIPPGGSGQVLLAVRPRQPKIAGPRSGTASAWSTARMTEPPPDGCRPPSSSGECFRCPSSPPAWCWRWCSRWARRCSPCVPAPSRRTRPRPGLLRRPPPVPGRRCRASW